MAKKNKVQTPNLKLQLYLHKWRGILAIDYGTKKGLVSSDGSQSTDCNRALDTVHSKEVITYLKSYLVKEQVESFVVGEPRQMDNFSPKLLQ